MANEGESIGSRPDHPAGLAVRVALLENELAQLRQTVQKLCSELGMSPPGQT